MQKRANSARGRGFRAVYLAATCLLMLVSGIGRFDGGHCFPSEGPFRLRDMEVGGLHVEARDNDTTLVSRVTARDS